MVGNRKQTLTLCVIVYKRGPLWCHVLRNIVQLCTTSMHSTMYYPGAPLVSAAPRTSTRVLTPFPLPVHVLFGPEHLLRHLYPREATLDALLLG